VARIATAALLGLGLAAALGTQAPAAPSSGRLVAFASCSKYLGYVKSHAAPFVTAYGIGQNVRTAIPTPAAAGSARGQAVDYSTTNVQEAGVDEPDLVKTDGRTLFTVENGQLESTDVASGKPKLLDTLELSAAYGAQLLLAGDHLLVISRIGLWMEPLPAVAAGAR